MPFNRDYYEEIGRAAETGEAPATDWTQESARKAGLPEDFWRYALGRETGGTPNPFQAVSPAGAQGRAQLMPETAQDISKRYGIDTTTPYGNLQGGAYYMGEQLKRAQSEWAPGDSELAQRLALSAYNAGPTRVSSAVRQLQSQGQPLSWEAIQKLLPGETQSYAGRYSPTPLAPQPPKLEPPPSMAMSQGPPVEEGSTSLPQVLRSVGGLAQKTFDLPVIKQFGEAAAFQKRELEEKALRPAFGYGEDQTLGSTIGQKIEKSAEGVGVPRPLAGLGGAAASFFADMYTDPLYWELTGAGAALGASVGGVGALPGGALGFLTAGAARVLQNFPRLEAGLITGLRIAGLGFKTQMAAQALSKGPVGIADILEDPWGAEGYRNLGEAGLSAWYAGHQFLSKPTTQTGRVKVSQLVGDEFYPMEPGQAREILRSGSLGDLVNLIDSEVQATWVGLADQGIVPRTELPEFHALFNTGEDGRPRAASIAGEQMGRLGIDIGHLAADVQSMPPEQRAAGLAKIIAEVTRHEIAHLVDRAGLPHDPRLPTEFRKEMAELQRRADFSADDALSYEDFVRARDEAMARYNVTPDLMHGDPYSNARQMVDSIGPNTVARIIAKVTGQDPSEFVQKYSQDPVATLKTVDWTPFQKLIDGLQVGVGKIQARTLGALQPEGLPERTPEQVIARMAGSNLKTFAPAPTEGAPEGLTPPPAMEAAGEGGRRGFRVEYDEEGKPIVRAAAVLPKFAARKPEGAPIEGVPALTRAGRPPKEGLRGPSEPLSPGPETKTAEEAIAQPEPGGRSVEDVVRKAARTKLFLPGDTRPRTITAEEAISGKKMKAEGEEEKKIRLKGEEMVVPLAPPGSDKRKSQERLAAQGLGEVIITDKLRGTGQFRIQPAKMKAEGEEPVYTGERGHPKGVKKRTGPPEEPTLREKQVLGHLADGKTARATADALGLSFATVRNHITHARERMDASSIQEAIRFSRENGWLPKGKELELPPQLDRVRDLVSSGMTDSEIAKEVGVTLGAAKRLVEDLREKAGGGTRAGAMRAEGEEKGFESKPVESEKEKKPSAEELIALAQKYSREKPVVQDTEHQFFVDYEMERRAKLAEKGTFLDTNEKFYRAEGEDFKALTDEEKKARVETLLSQGKITQKVYDSAMDRISRGWEKPEYVVKAMKEGPPSFKPPQPGAKVELPKKITTQEKVIERPQEEAQVGGGTERTTRKMQTFGVWGRLTREQKAVQREAAAVTERSLKRTPEEIERERVKALAEEARPLPPEDAYRIVLERLGGKHQNLTPEIRAQIREELGKSPTLQNILQVVGKITGEPETAPGARVGRLTPPPKMTTKRLADELEKLGVKFGPRKMKAEGEDEREAFLARAREIGKPTGKYKISPVERFRASVDIPPTPKGLEDATKLGEAISKQGKFAEIYHDNQIRTKATAEALSRSMPEAKLVDLGEASQSQALGKYEGAPVNADTLGAMRRLVANPDERPEGRNPDSTRGGETFNEFLDRYLPLVDKLKQHAEDIGEPVALITHNRNIQVINARLDEAGAENLAGRRINPEVMNEKGPQTNTISKVIDHATEDWAGKKLDPGLYLIRHATTAWNGAEAKEAPSPQDVLQKAKELGSEARAKAQARSAGFGETAAEAMEAPPATKKAQKAFLKEAKGIGLGYQRFGPGTKTKTAADFIKIPRRMKAEGEDVANERAREAAEIQKRELEGKPEPGDAARLRELIKANRKLYQTRSMQAAGEKKGEEEALPGVGVDDRLWEKLGAPRAFITSLDLSGVLRQGAIGSAALLVRKPGVLGEALVKSVKALASEDTFQKGMKEVEASPEFHTLRALGVDFADSEEQFAGARFAEKALEKLGVPNFVRGSERAYTYYLNRLRYELGAHHLQNLRRLGFEVGSETSTTKAGTLRTELFGKDAEVFKKMGQWVNIATGRGGLPQGQDTLSKSVRSADSLLNAVLFSPRLMYSRLALFNPWTYMRVGAAARATGASRTQAVRAALALHAVDGMAYAGLAAGMAAGLSVLLGKDSEFETDMLSSDFGQVRKGNTRIDVSGGVRTYATLLARLATQQTKTEYGNIKYQSGWDTLKNFLRGKLSPTVGTALNLATGENLVGQKQYETLSDVFHGRTPLDADSLKDILTETGGGLASQIAVPMILSDAYSLVSQGWTPQEVVPLMAGLVLGVGVSTRQSPEGMSLPLQERMRDVLVSSMQGVGKIRSGVNNLLGEPIYLEPSKRQRDEIVRQVDTPFYQTLSTLVEQPSFVSLPPEAQRIVLISVMASAKKLRAPVGMGIMGPTEVEKGIQEGLIPEEYGRLTPPPAFAKREIRPTDLATWFEGSDEES